MVRSKGLTGLNPLAYKGVEAATPPNLTIADRAPTTNDSIGYNLGDLWLLYRKGFPNTGTVSDIYVLVGLERDVAHWINFFSGIPIETLTGDTGGPVAPDGLNNIFTLGDAAVNLRVDGNPGINTLTVTTVSGNPAATDFPTDVGTAYPDVNGVLNIITDQPALQCGNTVYFSGAGNTVELHVTDSDNNTTIGIQAGSTAKTTGNNNTSLGTFTLVQFTSGEKNIALGNETLNALTTGSNNIGIGFDAGTALDVGADNIFIGDSSGISLTSGNVNIGIGNQSLYALTTTGNNIGLGHLSLTNLVNGGNNIAIGYNAGSAYTGAESENIIIYNPGVIGENDTTRIGTEGLQTAAFMAGINGNITANNPSVGVDALTGQLGTNNAITLGNLATIAVGTPALTITSGDILFGGDINDPTKTYRIRFPSNGPENIISFFLNNIFMGSGAGNLTMTPAVALFNIGIGASTCKNITTGTQNSALGNAALEGLTTGNNNHMVGYTAGQWITTGTHNIGIGSGVFSRALAGLTTGQYNIAIGNLAGADYTGAESNNINIGDSEFGVVGESNVIRLGSFTGGTPQTKTFIQGIRGKTTVNADAIAVLIDSAGQLGTISSSLRYKEHVESLGNETEMVLSLRPVSFNYKDNKDKKYYGFIAEEVEQIFPYLVAYDQEGKPESVKYHELPVLLLKEIQKLSKRVEELERIVT